MEWFFYNKNDRTNIGCLIIAVLIVICCIFVAYHIMKPKNSNTDIPQLDPDFVTLRIKTVVLKNALDSVEWLKVSTWRTFKIESDVSNSQFEQIFLHGTDSLAIKMSEEYPDLYKFQIKNNKYIFTMKKTTSSFTSYTIVPAWLLVNLIDNNILHIPETYSR